MRAAASESGILALSFLVLSAAEAPAKTVRFDGGHWFNGESFVPRTTLAVDGVLAEGDGTAAADTVESLAGLFVVPPLADAHTHAVADSPDPARDIARFVRAGILFAKNPNSTWGGMARGRDALAKAHPAVLTVVYSGSGLTSPGGHPAQIYESQLAPGQVADGWLPVGAAEELEGAWARVRGAKPDFVKIYLESSEEHARRKDDAAFRGQRGLDPELVPRIVQRAHAEDLSVSAHVRTASDFRVAVASGVDEINHLPLERIDASDAKACAEAHVTVVTTVLSHRPVDGLTDVEAMHRTNIERLHDAGVSLALGTDNMHVDVVDELLAVAALEVFDAPELVRLATTESIRAVVRSRDVGTLEPSAAATFLALRRDPSEDPSAFRDIAFRFVRGELVPEPTLTPDPPTLAEELLNVVMHESLDAAIAKYHEWRRERPGDFDFGEPQLNALGYALLHHGRAADAVRVFALNTEQYPRSANVWDSLGEAQLAAGDRAAVEDSARRVLSLLPDAHDLPPTLRSQLEATARARLAGE